MITDLQSQKILPSQTTPVAYCLICKNLFDFQNRTPLVFPCGHTFCQTCVNLNMHKTSQFTVQGLKQLCKWKCQKQITNYPGEVNQQVLNIIQRINLSNIQYAIPHKNKSYLKKALIIGGLILIIIGLSITLGIFLSRSQNRGNLKTNKSQSTLGSNSSTYLYLNGSGLDDNDIDNLASYTYPELLMLDLSQNNITQDGMKTVLEDINMPLVRNIILSKNEIKNKNIEKISQKTYQQLLGFYLDNNQIDAEVINAIINLKFPHLIVFNISNNPKIGSQGLQILYNNQFLKHWNIALSNIGLGNQGMHLISTMRFDAIGYLDLSSNGISEIYDFSPSQFQYEAQINLRGNPLSKQARDVLSSRFGGRVLFD